MNNTTYQHKLPKSISPLREFRSVAIPIDGDYTEISMVIELMGYLKKTNKKGEFHWANSSHKDIHFSTYIFTERLLQDFNWCLTKALQQIEPLMLVDNYAAKYLTSHPEVDKVTFLRGIRPPTEEEVTSRYRRPDDEQLAISLQMDRVSQNENTIYL